MNKREMGYKNFICLALIFSLLFSFFSIPKGRAVSDKLLSEPCAAQIVSLSESNTDEVKVSLRLWELLFGKKENKEDNGKGTDELRLIPGGMVFGTKIKGNCVKVTNPVKNCELQIGDTIYGIDGMSVNSIEQIKELLQGVKGGFVLLECERDGNKFTTKIELYEEQGVKKMGLALRDSAAGIGTVTYIDPETHEFGGLGHGIFDGDSGELFEVGAGTATGVILGGVHKGASGKPGELTGVLTDKVIGEVYSNTGCGVFGKFSSDFSPSSLYSEPLVVGKRDEVHEGAATILSTVKNGKVYEYSIKIHDIDLSSDGSKSFKIKVTDPVLIAETGGIVRGMSGSPIIQDGKLVGAVTHVMVANSTEGYGIFIENMLNAANGQAQPKAA